MVLIGILGAPYMLYRSLREWWRERKSSSEERKRPHP
jgi:hypothetical protein